MNRDNREMTEGNTKPQSNQLSKWFFTWNNYITENITTLETLFNKICKEYVFQEEIGENGTPHLQGSIFLYKPMRWTEFNLPKEIHWEKTRCKNAAMAYCEKTATNNGKCYKKMPETYFNDDILTINELKPWQRDLEEKIIEKPNNRTVTWIYDKKGGEGKTSFVKYMIKKYHEQILFCRGGKRADIINLLENSDIKNMRCFIFDLPRDNDKISYVAIEEIKDGLICNTKFKSGCKIFNSPHVIIFSNCLPETQYLSIDRWDIYTIAFNNIVSFGRPPFKVGGCGRDETNSDSKGGNGANKTNVDFNNIVRDIDYNINYDQNQLETYIDELDS